MRKNRRTYRTYFFLARHASKHELYTYARRKSYRRRRRHAASVVHGQLPPPKKKQRWRNGKTSPDNGHLHTRRHKAFSGACVRACAYNNDCYLCTVRVACKSQCDTRRCVDRLFGLRRAKTIKKKNKKTRQRQRSGTRRVSPTTFSSYNPILAVGTRGGVVGRSRGVALTTPNIILGSRKY